MNFSLTHGIAIPIFYPLEVFFELINTIFRRLFLITVEHAGNDTRLELPKGLFEDSVKLEP
jgi:hypothetical protein